MSGSKSRRCQVNFVYYHRSFHFDNKCNWLRCGTQPYFKLFQKRFLNYVYAWIWWYDGMGNVEINQNTLIYPKYIQPSFIQRDLWMPAALQPCQIRCANGISTKCNDDVHNSLSVLRCKALVLRNNSKNWDILYLQFQWSCLDKCVCRVKSFIFCFKLWRS